MQSNPRQPTSGSAIDAAPGLETGQSADRPLSASSTDAASVDVANLRDILADAELPPLLPALACVTGDLSLLRDVLRVADGVLEEQGGLSGDQQESVRALAEDTLLQLQARGSVQIPPLDPAELRRILSFATGDRASEGQLDFLEEELGLYGADMRAPRWHKADLCSERPFVVGVIGAGMSGLVAAHRLAQAGLDYVVLEKNADVGGTWFENRYPGCRVDITSHAYSYSFAQNPAWPNHFSPQVALLEYFRRFADASGIRQHVRFGTEVISATFDGGEGLWRVRTRSAEGEAELVVHALVSAVGQLNRPRLPDIEGMDSFAGPSFHSARWDDSLDVAGKRVAVIGTGASAAQLVPAIAGAAERVTVFQRTPAWFLPDPRYHQPISHGLQWLFDHLPTYSQWYRFWQVWQGTETLLAHCRVDPGWSGDESSVGTLNDEVRGLLTQYLESEFADRPDLLERVVPSYPPMAKRILIDDGSWATTIQRDNVSLVTNPIERITPAGVRTVGGTEHGVDVILYATGFHASKFLMPMEIVGDEGRSLNEFWAGDARAYLGVTVPHFPNLFLLYGPNTNIVINGSIVFFSECSMTLVMECLRLLLSTGERAMAPRLGAYEEYNRRIDEGNRNMVWGVSSVNSWYRNEFGRSAQNWPFGLYEFWEQTRAPDPDAFAYV